MDYTVGKIGSKIATGGGVSPEQTKTGPSKFDSIRSDLAAQFNSQLQPPEPAQVTPTQKSMLENDLRQRLQDGGGQAVRNSLEQQANVAQARIVDLKNAVARLPQMDALAPLRDRLKGIEAEYNASGDLLKQLPKVDNPQQLMNIQMQLYHVTQNLEMMSKMVDQVSSGIKTVLETHVG